jgi:hypothetical protein
MFFLILHVKFHKLVIDYKSKCPRTFQEEIDSSCKRNEDPLLSPLFTPEGNFIITNYTLF